MIVLPPEIVDEQRIDELHAWIATHTNGGEGIVAGILPGLGTTPLVTARRHVAEKMGGLARSAAERSPDIAAVELVTFRRVR